MVGYGAGPVGVGVCYYDYASARGGPDDGGSPWIAGEPWCGGWYSVYCTVSRRGFACRYVLAYIAIFAYVMASLNMAPRLFR